MFFGTIKRIVSFLNNVFGCLSMYLPRESLFYMSCFEMIDLNHCITNVIFCLSLNFVLQTCLSLPLWTEFPQPLRIIHNLMNPRFGLKANFPPFLVMFREVDRVSNVGVNRIFILFLIFKELFVQKDNKTKQYFGSNLTKSKHSNNQNSKSPTRYFNLKYPPPPSRLLFFGVSLFFLSFFLILPF